MQLSLASDSHSPQPPTPLLLGAQTAFNIGFYAVVPFIALVLAQDFMLGATAVGIILGTRTFAQQGMFLVGGTLADMFGARSVLLVGVAVRVTGFFALGYGTHTAGHFPALGLPLFIAGTVLTGLGGALFSPALNLYIAEADRARSTSAGASTRTSLFAWLNVTGEVGAVTGPLVGYALITQGFTMVALIGAALFALLWLIFWLALPRPTASRQDATRAPSPLKTIETRVLAVVKDRTFTRFTALHSVDLFCYNQLYFALPLLTAPLPHSSKVLALAFALVSILIFACQIPSSRWAAKFSTSKVLATGYTLSAVGLVSFAAAQWILTSSDAAASSTWISTLAITGALCIAVGHLLASPRALSHTADYAPQASTAAYLGFIATCGGFAVLLGNILLGLLLDTLNSGLPASQPLVWVALAVAVLAAGLIQRSLPTSSR